MSQKHYEYQLHLIDKDLMVNNLASTTFTRTE